LLSKANIKTSRWTKIHQFLLQASHSKMILNQSGFSIDPWGVKKGLGALSEMQTGERTVDRTDRSLQAHFITVSCVYARQLNYLLSLAEISNKVVTGAIWSFTCQLIC
jgi:hypothetical protein